MSENALPLATVKAHFEAKGFTVTSSADADGRTNTLSCSLRGETVFSLKVDTRDGTIDAGHLREMASRYSAGLPLMDPHSRRLVTE